MDVLDFILDHPKINISVQEPIGYGRPDKCLIPAGGHRQDLSELDVRFESCTFVE